jgi:hypothetical protein
LKARRGEGTPEKECKQRGLEFVLREAESWIFKTTETVKLASRVKEIVTGRIEIRKRRASSELVCVETAQLSLKVVLAARGDFRAFTKASERTRQP